MARWQRAAVGAWRVRGALVTCRRCKDSTCGGCVTEVDCVTCEQPVSIDHTDSKGRCPSCAAGVAAALEADREEIALELDALIPTLDTPHDCASVEMAARRIRARGNVRLP